MGEGKDVLVRVWIGEEREIKITLRYLRKEMGRKLTRQGKGRSVEERKWESYKVC